MNIVILGLSITSSWGNGHATTYRALVRELNNKGHNVLFLEKDVPWYASHRDLPAPEYCRVGLYPSLEKLALVYTETISKADLVIVGSYVPDGTVISDWILNKAKGIKAFYDIDTPVTLAKLAAGDDEYLAPHQIKLFDVYLSFAGGKALDILQTKYKAQMARPLYCSVDPLLYYPEQVEEKWLLGYLGTYSSDRQPPLEKLMLSATKKFKSKRFVVAGPGYPTTVEWPENVERIDHLPPDRHRSFYNAQRFTMNITRKDMVYLGHSPSVRLFEAAATGTPIISDYWTGIEELFEPGVEILISKKPQDTLDYLNTFSAEEARAMGERARQRVLKKHTSKHRAEELECYVKELLKEEIGT